MYERALDVDRNGECLSANPAQHSGANLRLYTVVDENEKNQVYGERIG